MSSDIQKQVKDLDKKVNLVIDAQKKFYPEFHTNIKKLIKAFNDLNTSVKSVGSMAGLFGSIYEENKETISQISSQISNNMKETKKEEKQTEIPT